MLELNVITRHRAPLYGLLALWIVPLHLWMDYGADFSCGFAVLQPLAWLISYGSVAVDAFLLISGVCLCWGYERQSKVYDFWKRRFVRVLPAALIIFGGYWIVRDGIAHGEWERVLWQCLFINPLLNDRTTANWFVSGILVLYLAYPLFHHFLCEEESMKKRVRNLVVGSICWFILCREIAVFDREWYVLVEVLLMRVPIFMLGTFLGPLVRDGYKLPGWTIVLMPLLVVAGLLGLVFLVSETKWYFRLPYYVGGIGVAFFGGYLLDVIDRHELSKRVLSQLWRFVAWVGGFSLEMYCAHQVIRRLLDYVLHFQTWDNAWLMLLLVYATSIPVAWGVRKIVLMLAERREAKVSGAAVVVAGGQTEK